MGLNCSHDAFHGAYGKFHRWRRTLADLADYPLLDIMAGFYTQDTEDHCRVLLDADAHFTPNIVKDLFYNDFLPISWDNFKDDPLIELLRHSDCAGDISPESCEKIADRIEYVTSNIVKNVVIDEQFITITETFVKGLRAAHEANEPLIFG